MKKILLIAAFFFSILLAKAQSQDRVFNSWKVDVSLGAAMPQGGGSKGGGLFALEPKYALTDQCWVGLRIETAVMDRYFSYSDGSSFTKISASVSYLPTFDYYFTTSNFRPFIGIGVGVFRIASVSADESGGNGDDIAASTKFGGMARAGFEAGHFRLGVEYNIVGNTTIQTYDYNSGNTVNSSFKNGYLGIKLGVVFGGARL